jgi:hypothetical protein
VNLTRIKKNSGTLHFITAHSPIKVEPKEVRVHSVSSKGASVLYESVNAVFTGTK